MDLRFDVDQAEAFRLGVDAPKSVMTVSLDPKTLDQATRHLIADRLSGIDVLQLQVNAEGEIVQSHDRILAILPDFDSMVQAVRHNQDEVRRIQKELAEATKAGNGMAFFNMLAAARDQPFRKVVRPQETDGAKLKKAFDKHDK